MSKKTNTVKQTKWKFLLIEDGSVDIDELQQFFDEQDMKIKIVIYRQGSPKPKPKQCFYNLKEKENADKD